MKSCGIIAEYNPFHNGHRYQLETAREQSQSDVMIVVMSGNFTQRGEPAIVDKWVRAEMALRNGADLVVEQSVLGSVQATDLFARAGVRLLHALGCDFISFGAEDGTSQQFLDFTQLYAEQEAEINHHFQTLRNDGRSYPTQMQDALTTVLGGDIPSFSFWQPNNQLGLGYLRENATYTVPMQPIVVARKGAKHHDPLSPQDSFASGTALRELLQQGETANIGQWLPPSAVSSLQKASKQTWESYWPLLRYRVILEDVEQLCQIYQMEEGIEHRLKKMVGKAESFVGFIGLVKNKRWTWTRLQRLCIAILLQIRKSDVAAYFQKPPPIRVLGFTESGQHYLRQLKKESGQTFLTNINQKNQSELSLELKADQIYQLGNQQRIWEQNYTRQPIRVIG